MKLTIFVLAMFVFMLWVASWAAKNDAKIIDACAAQGGIVMHSLEGFVCVRRDAIIKVQLP